MFHKLQFSENQADSTSTEVQGLFQAEFKLITLKLLEGEAAWMSLPTYDWKILSSGHVYYWNQPTNELLWIQMTIINFVNMISNCQQI